MPKYWITYSRDLKERVLRRLWMGSIQKFQNLSIHEFNTSNWYDPACTNTEKICVACKILCCGVRVARWWCYLQYTWNKFGNTANCNIHNVQSVTLCLTFMGPCIIIIIRICIKWEATLHSLFYLETALQVLGSTSTHLQERKQLYLQYLVLVIP